MCIRDRYIANPLATILSAAMMFEDAFGLMEEGRAIRDAVNMSLKSKIFTKDLASNKERVYKTNEVGEWIAINI